MTSAAWLKRVWVILGGAVVVVSAARAESAALVDSKLWLPSEIGQGAFGLQPDQAHIYKTVTTNGQPVELKLHAFLPEGHKASDQRPAIVFFHGGGWYGGTPDQFYPQCRYLALRGMVAFSVQYRTINAFKTSPRECVMDGKSAVRWVRQHAAELGIDPARIAAGGGSAGGHIAAATALVDAYEEEGEEQAVSCHPDALVLYNPVFDNGPNGFAHGLVKDYWTEISPIDRIDEQVPPSIVLLGTKDQHVPVETGRRFERLMREEGRRCDLTLYEGKGHAWFNLWVSRDDLADTMVKVDHFLASLGYLQGEPILKVAGSGESVSFVVSGYTYEQPAFEKGSRLLFQGDSITDMGRVRDQSHALHYRHHHLGHGYAYLLAARLPFEMPEADLEFINRGISGDTIGDLRNRWQVDALDEQPDILTILVGINNVLKNKGLDTFEADYRHLLDASRKQNPDLRIVLIDPFAQKFGLPDHPERWPRFRAETDRLRGIVARLAKDYDAVHIRTQELFDAAAEAVSIEHWLWDGIHPTEQGQELIARHWLKEVNARWPNEP